MNTETTFEIYTFEPTGADQVKRVGQVCDLPYCKVIKIDLKENAVLSRHKSSEPITILCLAGNGQFRAGTDLGKRTQMKPGVLISLNAGIFHEIVAEPEISILVTKFKWN